MDIFNFHIKALVDFLYNGGHFPFVSVWTAVVFALLSFCIIASLWTALRGTLKNYSSLALLTGLMGLAVVIGHALFQNESPINTNDPLFINQLQTSFIIGSTGGTVAIFLHMIEKFHFGPDPIRGMRRMLSEINTMLKNNQQELVKLSINKQTQSIPIAQNDNKEMQDAIMHISQQIFDLTKVLQMELKETRTSLNLSIAEQQGNLQRALQKLESIQPHTVSSQTPTPTKPNYQPEVQNPTKVIKKQQANSGKTILPASFEDNLDHLMPAQTTTFAPQQEQSFANTSSDKNFHLPAAAVEETFSANKLREKSVTTNEVTEDIAKPTPKSRFSKHFKSLNELSVSEVATN